MDGHHPMVQFIHNVPTQSAVYFVAHAPIAVLQQVKNLTFSKLSSHFIIDLLIFGYILDNHLGSDVPRLTGSVVEAEARHVQLPVIEDSHIRDIHGLAQRIAIDVSRYEEFINQIAFLLSVVDVLHRANGIPKTAFTYVTETLQAKERYARNIHLWYQGYQKRVDIQINLAFNLRFQRDSDTNVRIAKDTAKIAEDAQRDSASMITQLTKVPQAIFSMVFFNVDVETGKSTFSVSPKLWYFFVVTAP
ncbi:hypothetical protein BDQ17DRAFT_1328861 [Cyathus striatus]|nr:hypothetical protein BDQ17DRAFT_1328861 [Cyathus striatus]